MGGRKILTYTLTEESGASLRGAGWVLAATVKGHDTRTWGKRDHLMRREQAIHGMAKRRWEAINPNTSKDPAMWPEAVERSGPLLDFSGGKT